MTPSSTVEALARTRLFEGIVTEGLERLAAIASESNGQEGDYVFREGEAGDRLFLILGGKVRVSRNLPSGEEAISVLGAGEVFGEMALIDDAPRSADAIVHEQCRLLVISKDSIEDLMFLDKDLAYEILWNFVKILAARLRETNDKMAFLSMSGKF